VLVVVALAEAWGDTKGREFGFLKIVWFSLPSKDGAVVVVVVVSCGLAIETAAATTAAAEAVVDDDMVEMLRKAKKWNVSTGRRRQKKVEEMN